MIPRANNEFLSLPGFWGCPMLTHAEIIPERAAQKNIVPAAHITGRHPDRAMSGFNIPARPVLVVIRVGKPVIEIRSYLIQEREVFQWQVLKPCAQIINRADQLPEPIRRRDIFLDQAHIGIRRKAGQRPTGVKPEGKGSALIRPAFVIVGGGNQWKNGFEMGRRTDRGEPLGRTDIGRPIHADVTIRPRLDRTPLHRVIAVQDVISEGIKLPIGRVPPASVLDDHGIPLASRPHHVEHQDYSGEQIFIIRRALEDNGIFPRCGRAVHVGSQHGPIPHWDRDVFFNAET